MDECKVYKGMWFLPDKPNVEVAGTLYFYPNENIKLELIGSLSEMTANALFYQQDTNFPVIHGVVYGDNKAESITLFDCSSSWEYNFACQFALTTLHCTYMLVGKHINAKGNQLFDKIQIFFPCLRDWYPYRPIRFSVQNETKCQWEISYDDKNKKLFPIDTQINLILCTWAGYKTIFKDFLSLSVLTDVPFSTIILYDNDDFQELKDGKRIIHPIQFFFVTKKNSTDKYPTYNYLFKFNDIEQDFGNVIRKWYSESKQLAPIRTHLINSITYKRTFTSIDFLTVIQSIEGYYNRFIQESNLRTILTNLYDKFKNIQMISSNIVNFNQVKDSRDYYSHFFDKQKKQNVCDGIELYEVTSKLRLLLICCVLSLVGFSNADIDKFLKNSNKMRWEYS